MKKLVTIIMLLALAFAACKKDEKPLPFPNSGNYLSLIHPATGQQSKFIYFKGDDYISPGPQIYYNDTLVFRVIEYSDPWYIVRDSLTPGSASRNGAQNVFDADSVYSFKFKVENDSVYFAKNGPRGFSRLPSFAPVEQIALNPAQAEKTSFKYWVLDKTLGNQTGYVDDYQHLGYTFGRVNVYQNNGPMAYDGQGKTMAFSDEFGIVRWTLYGGWTLAGHGWDLIPE